MHRNTRTEPGAAGTDRNAQEARRSKLERPGKRWKRPKQLGTVRTSQVRRAAAWEGWRARAISYQDMAWSSRDAQKRAGNAQEQPEAAREAQGSPRVPNSGKSYSSTRINQRFEVKGVTLSDA